MEVAGEVGLRSGSAKSETLIVDLAPKRMMKTRYGLKSLIVL
jgi:hypothetical protein